LQSLAIPRLADSNGRAEVRRLDENRIPKLFFRLETNVPDIYLNIDPPGCDVRDNRKAALVKQTFHYIFVHADGRPKHTRSDVRNSRKFEQPLYCAVLTVRAVEDWKDDIEVPDFLARAAFRDGNQRPPGIGARGWNYFRSGAHYSLKRRKGRRTLRQG